MPAQSLVELALIAPLLIVLLVIVLDLGRVFTMWVALTNAAREGAYLASGQVAGSLTDQAVRDAVAGEGAVGIAADPTYVTVAYPSPNVILVTARAPFHPLAPLTGTLWGGADPWVSASAAFPVLLPTSTPLPITPSTPLPSPSPSPATTSSPTSTLTPAATPTRTLVPSASPTPAPASLTPTPTSTPGPCTTSFPIAPLAMNRGYYTTFTTASAGTISVTWTLSVKNNIQVQIYAGTPLAGQPNPSALSPPSGAVANNAGNVTSLTATAPAQAAGVYTAYFYNQGSLLPDPSTGILTYVKATCP